MIEYVLIVICIVLIIIPTKWDPAIKIKEWLDETNARK